MARARFTWCAGFFLLAALVMGCSPEPAAATTDGGESDTGDPFGDLDAGDPFTADTSLGRKARGFLGSCNGNEGCHVSGVAGLTFPPGDEARYVIDASSSERPSLLRAKPFDPSASYLYLKLLGDGGIDGSRMPPGQPFEPRLPALFFEWIEAGCPAP